MTAKLRFEIFPESLDRAADFYVRVLGFELLRDERGDDEAYIYLRRGEVRIGGLQSAVVVTADLRRPPAGIELVLEVDDLERERDGIVASGWPLADDITVRPWGLRDFRLLDPDGYYWRITTHGQ